MKTISVFIAGSTVLQTQRTKIKALASDLNGEYEKHGVHLQVFSYENFKDNQDAYNNFITTTADLVLFIIDDKIGVKTRSEFDLAKQTYSSNKHPKILVFIRKLDPLPSDIAHFEGIVEASTGDYCITYNNEDDLLKQVEIRLRRFITDTGTKAADAKPVSEKKHKSIGALNGKLAAGFLGLALLAVIAAICFMSISKRHDDNTLVIAGGGSAANHICNVSKINLSEYPNAFHMHMPSGAAWQLLTEDVISSSTNGNQRYIPVCVSASAATDSSFLSNIVTTQKFISNASVIAFDMGADPLSVYIEPTPYIKKILPKEIYSGKISVKRLAEIIQNEIDSVNIFPTTPQSGTRKKYHTLLADCGADLSAVKTTFTEISDPVHLTRGDRPYLLLGTASYYPTFFKDSTYQPRPISLTVVDSEEKPINKPVLLYCLAYVVNGNEISFPDVTKKFLKDLHQDTIPIIREILKAPSFMRKTDGKVILKPSELYCKTP